MGSNKFAEVASIVAIQLGLILGRINNQASMQDPTLKGATKRPFDDPICNEFVTLTGSSQESKNRF